jgi:thiol-disulfide isomerase/thioredoxin
MNWIRKNLLVLLTSILLVSACASTPKEVTTLRGQIKNEMQGTKIFLEEITYTSRTPLDTGELDAHGKFLLEVKLKSLGLYQVRIGETRSLLFVLDEKPATITVNADSASLRSFTYKVNGSPASDQLRSFIAETKKFGDAFGAAIREYEKNVNDSTPDSLAKVYESKVTMADSNFRVYARSYIDTVTNPVIAMFAVSNLDYERDRTLYDQVEEKVKAESAQLPFSQTFLAMVNSKKQPAQANPYGPKFATGTPAPDIVMTDVTGKERKLSSLKGNYVLLDFWASWCGPCRMENPNIVSAYEKYKSKDFMIFSVSLDTDKNKWINAIKKDNLYWPDHVSELKGWQSPICAVYGIRSIPQSFLLDPEGNIIATNLRGAELDRKLAEVLQ